MGRDEPCVRCGLKPGAHTWGNGGPHPRACSEWVDAYDLQREREEADGAWMIDSDMESQG